jgi:UDP-N-acetylmuramate--alanine ligase
VDSLALAKAIQRLDPDLSVQISSSLASLAQQLASTSAEGDLVLAMGAGDVNTLWEQLSPLQPRNALDGGGGGSTPLAA